MRRPGKVNRGRQSGIDPTLISPHLRALAPEIDWTLSGNTMKVWKKKKPRLIKWEKRGLLGFNSRVAMVGDLLANVGLMFS